MHMSRVSFDKQYNNLFTHLHNGSQVEHILSDLHLPLTN